MKEHNALFTPFFFLVYFSESDGRGIFLTWNFFLREYWKKECFSDERGEGNPCVSRSITFPARCFTSCTEWPPSPQTWTPWTLRCSCGLWRSLQVVQHVFCCVFSKEEEVHVYFAVEILLISSLAQKVFTSTHERERAEHTLWSWSFRHRMTYLSSRIDLSGLL